MSTKADPYAKSSSSVDLQGPASRAAIEAEAALHVKNTNVDVTIAKVAPQDYPAVRSELVPHGDLQSTPLIYNPVTRMRITIHSDPKVEPGFVEFSGMRPSAMRARPSATLAKPVVVEATQPVEDAKPAATPAKKRPPRNRKKA